MQAFSQVAEPTVPLCDLFILYSNARDVYSFCVALGVVVDSSEEISQLRTAMRRLAKIIITSVCKYLYDLSFNTSNKMLHAGFGNVFTVVNKVLSDIREFQRKLLDSTDDRDFLLDNVLGTQLFKIGLLDKKKEYIDNINSARTQRKHNEKEAKLFDDILLEFKLDDRLAALKVIEVESKEVIIFINRLIDNLIRKHELTSLKNYFGAFNECLKLNITLIATQLSRDDIEHLAFLLREYYASNHREINPVIIQAILRFEMAKPIFDAEIEDMWNFLVLDMLGGKATYITRRFISASSQFFKTYEALALATAVYNELNQILEEIIKLKITQTQSLLLSSKLPANLESEKQNIEKTGAIKQIRKYQNSFRSAFQLSMRLSMPIDEMIKNYKELRLFLEKIQSRQRQALITAISSWCERLSSCNDLLKQKTLGVNAFKDLIDYIAQLKVQLTKPEVSTFNVMFFRGNNYKPLMLQLKTYFEQISSSQRTEQHSNFQAIFDKIKSLFQLNRVSYQTLKEDDTATDEEKLLIAIYERFDTNVKKYHEDVKPRSLSASTGSNEVPPRNSPVSVGAEGAKQRSLSASADADDVKPRRLPAPGSS